MRIQTDGTSLTVREWQSRRELVDHLKDTANLIEIGSHADAPVRFLSVTFSADSRILPGVTVAVSSEFDSVDPQLYVLPASSLVLVGADDEIHGIRDLTQRGTFDIKLPGILRFVIPNEAARQLFVVSEIGVSCVSLDGSLLWEFARDVITDTQMVDNGKLALQFLDSSPVVLDLVTGKEYSA